MTTAHKRKTITVKASPGIDDDLIQWHRRIPPGNRQARLKMALRSGIADELAQLTALERVEQLFYQLADHLAAQTTGADVAPHLATLAEQIAALRSDMTNIVFAAPNGSTAPTQPGIEAAPQVSKAELDARAKNLKKAQW
jgi:hypothetical protein